MCASTEIDVRESASDCILASGEGFSSGGETSHPMSLWKAVSSSRERTVLTFDHGWLCLAPNFI
jgi:hypothetical protein